MSLPATNRKITLLQATAINMIDMVGIGPFVVMPFVVAQFGDGLFIWAWIFGAFTAFADGMIWSELGARFPLAGGTYNFHRLTFGPRFGRLMSFLFVWQTSFQAPLVVASAAIGFSHYLTYLVQLSPVEQKLVSSGLILLVLFLLYRRIGSIGRISVGFGILVMVTILWIVVSGFTHRQQEINWWPSGSSSFFQFSFWAAIAHGSIKSVYSYLGYYNVCHLGGEIRRPEVNIPRSIFISIAIIAVLYLLMNTAVMSVVPWQSVRADDKYLVSTFMEKLHGPLAGKAVTVLILAAALSSLFAVVLGYSRVPYAAAVDGNYFPVFARLHPTKNFPHISLLVLCGTGLLVSLFLNLSQLITAILAMRILVQFIAQGVGVWLLHANSKKEALPFRMWLFPLPVIVSIATWIFLLVSTGWFACWGLLIALTGVIVFGLTNREPRAPGNLELDS